MYLGEKSNEWVRSVWRRVVTSVHVYISLLYKIFVCCIKTLSRKRNIDEALLKMIVVDLQLPNIVEDDG